MNEHQTRDYSLLAIFSVGFLLFLFALAGKISLLIGGVGFLLSTLSYILLAQTVATQSVAGVLGILFLASIAIGFFFLNDTKNWVIFGAFVYLGGCLLGHLSCMQYQNITIRYDTIGSAKKIARYISLGMTAFVCAYVWFGVGSLETDGKVDNDALHTHVSSIIDTTNDKIKLIMKKDVTILDLSSDELISSKAINIGSIMGITPSSPAANNPEVKRAVLKAQKQLQDTLLEQVYTFASVPKEVWKNSLLASDLLAYKASALISDHFLVTRYELTIFSTLSTLFILSFVFGLLSLLSATILRILLSANVYEFRNGYIEKQYLE